MIIPKSVIIFTLKILGATLSFITSYLISKYLGKEFLGMYSSSLTVLNSLLIVCVFGLNIKLMEIGTTSWPEFNKMKLPDTRQICRVREGGSCAWNETFYNVLKLFNHLRPQNLNARTYVYLCIYTYIYIYIYIYIEMSVFFCP